MKDWAGTPWKRGQAQRKCEEEGRFPDFGGKELTKAATTFSARTGWEVDILGPMPLMWLSDDLLHSIAAFIKAVERVGMWPQQLQEV